MRRLYVFALISILLLAVPIINMNHKAGNTSTAVSIQPQDTPVVKTMATTQTFILTESNNSYWYEFSVEPGIYAVEVETQNKGLGVVDVDIDLYQKEKLYAVPLGREVETWSLVSGVGSSLWLGQPYYWRKLVTVRSSGSMAVSIETSDSSGYRVEGEIIIDKIAGFDGLENIPSAKNITMSEGTEYIVYKIDPGAYNITTLSEAPTQTIKYSYVYVWIAPWDIWYLDEGEQIEIYINDTKVGTIREDSWDIERYSVPEIGTYEIKLKYTNTTKAYGVYIDDLYIYYRWNGAPIYNRYWININTWLDATSSEYTFTSDFYYTDTPTLYFMIYDADTGVQQYLWSLWGYDYDEEIVYINDTSYFVIEKSYVDMEANITIYSSAVTYETINPGETKTVVLDEASEYKYLFFNFEKDHYYKIYMDVSSNINWSVLMRQSSPWGGDLAYIDTYWNYEEYTTRLVMTELTYISRDSPLYKFPKIYTIHYTYLEFEDGNLTDIDYHYRELGIVSGVFVCLYGYNYSAITGSDDYATVTIHLEDLGEIASIGSGETKEVSLSYGSDGKIYEVLKLDVEIGKEYKVTIKPKSIDGEGMVEASMSENSEYAVLETYNPDAYGGYGLYESKPFRTTEDKILFEYFTNIAGTCYIWIERDDDPENFNGTISVSLEVVDPQPMSHTDNVYSASWQSTGDDRVKIFSVPIEKDRAYRINITTGNPDVAFDIIPIHESGITLLYDDLQVETYGYPYSNTYGYTFISSRFSSPRNGTVYIILVAEGNNEISITVEDVTAIPEVPITQNMYIWLPVGIAVGAVVVLLVMKILEKRRA